jgi:hypothetical protein
VSFKVHGEVRHAHQGILERLEVRRRPSTKALEQPGSFDLGDHRLCFGARDGASPQRRRLAGGLVDQVFDLQPASVTPPRPVMACRTLARSCSIIRPVFGPRRLPLVKKPNTD